MVSEGKIRQLFAYVKFPRKIFLILQRATLWQFSVICDLFVILSPWSSHRDDGKKWQKLWATRKVFSTLGDVSSQDMEQLYGKKNEQKNKRKKNGHKCFEFLDFYAKNIFFLPYQYLSSTHLRGLLLFLFEWQMSPSRFPWISKTKSPSSSHKKLPPRDCSAWKYMFFIN